MLNRLLLGAVVGTQVIATLIAVFGLLMTPLGWGWAAAGWGYALFWFLVEDRVELATHRWLDNHPRQGPHHRAEAHSNSTSTTVAVPRG